MVENLEKEVAGVKLPQGVAVLKYADWEEERLENPTSPVVALV